MRSALAVLAVITGVGVAVVARSAATASDEGIDRVQVLAINDFHGALKPPFGAGGQVGETDAGGAAYLATHLRRLRRGRSITVGGGDMIGGTPMPSALFRDEPAVAVLDALGVRISALGNHELDDGADEFLRLQNGGCGRAGCKSSQRFSGARMRWLAANVRRKGKPLLPSYRIERFGGLRIGFIGVTLQDTPSVTVPGATTGLRFRAVAESTNKAAAELDRRGVDGVFVLVHDGGKQGVKGPDPNKCESFSGPVTTLAKRLSGRVDAIAAAHAHTSYVCRIGGKLVASAGSNGRLITDWRLAFERGTRRLRSVEARNVVVDRKVAPDAGVQALIDRYQRQAAPVARRVVAALDKEIEKSDMPAVVAAANVAATRTLGAQAGLANPGGVRTGLRAGTVRYEDVFGVLPFGYRLVVRSYTAGQLAAVLAPGAGMSELVPSPNLSYKPATRTVVLDGRRLAGDERVRVVLNEALAAGNDGFTVLRAGTGSTRGPRDVDALGAYLRKRRR